MQKTSGGVEIRLVAGSADELDAYEAALRIVLDIPAGRKRNYANRRVPGIRRYLRPTGLRAAAAAEIAGQAGRTERPQ